MRPTVVLPYDPNYKGHREAERRHAATQRWLRERERLFAMKSLGAAVPSREKRAKDARRKARRLPPRI